MIEDPPLLVIQARTIEISDADLKELSTFPTSFVVDAMDGKGALPPGVKTLSEQLPASFCGRVLTVDPGPADVMATLASLSEIQPGDVMVIATDGYQGCAAIGDRVIGMAKNAGAIAVVTDGLVRDIDGIEKVGLPVFCSGVSPNSPYNSGPGKIGTDVIIGDRVVTRNDVMLGDRDGAVVVPGPAVERVLERCRHIASIEQALDSEVEQGLKFPDAVAELVASDRVRRV